MNILLSTAGRRTYMVDYFERALNGEGIVYVSDSDPEAPASLYTKNNIISPLIHTEEYIPFMLEKCEELGIDAIIPLSDLDLPTLATNKDKFINIGVSPIVSNPDVITLCNDKWKSHNFYCENGFFSPKTYIDIDKALRDLNKGELSYPLIIKPRWGMGSMSIFEAGNAEELKVLYKIVYRESMNSFLKHESMEDPEQCVIIQQKLTGQDYCLDVINNLNGDYQHTVVKKKYKMRSGEADKASTVKFDSLKKLGEKLGNQLGHIGNLDVDIFVEDSKLYVLEMNARFGGAFPFSYMAGVDEPMAIIEWLKGNTADVKSLLFEEYDIVSYKDMIIKRV